MSAKPRLDHAIKIARQNRQLQQFGQGHDDLVHDGMTGCTHTICQYLALLWNDQVLTLNRVNIMAGMPPNARSEVTHQPRGMRPSELRTFLNAAQIPMVIKYDKPFARLMRASRRGPVFYGMRYGSAPRRKGTRSENGFARPVPPFRRGATQRGIPDTRHAVLLLGFLQRLDASGKVIATNVYRKEPNHGSPNRPERPPFDRIFGYQARREYEDYRDKLGMRLYAAWPRRGTASPIESVVDEGFFGAGEDPVLQDAELDDDERDDDELDDDDEEEDTDPDLSGALPEDDDADDDDEDDEEDDPDDAEAEAMANDGVPLD